MISSRDRQCFRHFLYKGKRKRTILIATQVIPFSPKGKSYHFEMQGKSTMFSNSRFPNALIFLCVLCYKRSTFSIRDQSTNSFSNMFLAIKHLRTQWKIVFFSFLNLDCVSVSLFLARGEKGTGINHKCRWLCFAWYQKQLARLGQVFLFNGKSYTATTKTRERRLNIYEILWWLKL